MRLLIPILFAMSISTCAHSQSRIHPDVLRLDNSALKRTGHKAWKFIVDDDILREVRRHKKRYEKYFMAQLPDTSKIIVAHFLLLKITGDTLSMSERIFENDSTGRPGYDYALSGLKFRKRIYGKYQVDVTTVDAIRNRWMEVLDKK